MPFKVVAVEGGYKVQDDQGKFYSDKPLGRGAAARQARALYARVPEARKKEDPETAPEEKAVSAVPTGINASGPGGLSGVMGMGGKRWTKKRDDIQRKTSEKHGNHDQSTHGRNRAGGSGKRESEAERIQRAREDYIGDNPQRQWMRNAGSLPSANARKKPAQSRPKKQSTPDAGARKNAQSAVRRMESELSKASDLLKRTDASLSRRANPSLQAARNKLEKDVRGMEARIADAKRKYQLKEALEILLADEVERVSNPSGSLSVIKDSQGEHRWLLFSSNAFRDREKEIVSRAALEADVDASDQAGEYGPLLWWHLNGLKGNPVCMLGNCDFRMVHGRTLIESGTFDSKEIGEAVAKAAPFLQVSIGFNHPADEPDEDGVFHTIRTFERSLLPRGKAANPFTKVSVKGEISMASKKQIQEKLAALKTLGIDPDSVLKDADAAEKQLDAAGIAFKEVDEEADEDETEVSAKEGEEAESEVESPEANAEKAKKPAKAAPEEDEDSDDEEGEEEDDDVIGNMPVSAYKSMLEKAFADGMKAAMEPVTKMLHTHDPKKEEEQRTKEASERTALKEQVSALEQQIASQQAALAAAQQALATATKALSDTGEQLKQTNTRLTELEGSQPRYLSGGFVASQDDSTVINEERVKELGAPAPDPAAAGMQSFMNFAFGKPNQ